MATASTLPIMLDSTEPPVLQAGLERLGGRSIINSVNYEDGDGPESRFAKVMPMVVEHGAAVVALTIDETGQARTREHKLAVAERLIADLTDTWGLSERGHHDRLPDLPDRHRPGGDPPGRHRDHRGDRRTEAPAPRRADHARGVQRVVRAEPGRPAGAELGVPRGMREGGSGLRDRAPVEDPADDPDPGGAADRRARPGLRPPPGGLRPAGTAAGDVRGRDRGRRSGQPGRRTGDPAVGRAPTAPDRRRRTKRAGGRPRRGAADPDRPGDRQRHPACRDEDGRRPVRLRCHAVAVRPHLRRGDEVCGGPSGAAHGQVRRGRQGHRRARHGQGRRPRHRQEPGRHHPDQQRLLGGEPRDQAADRGDPVRRGRAPRRRHRHVRAAGQVHRGDEGQPRGDERPRRRGTVSGAARRGGADPLLRRERPVRGVPGRRPLRARRLRGPAADGPGDVGQARAGAGGRQGRAGQGRGAPGAAPPVRPDRRGPTGCCCLRGRRRAGRGAVRRRDRQPDPVPPFWGSRVVKGVPLADYAALLDERRRSSASGDCAAPGAATGPSYEELVETEGRPRLRALLDRLHTEQCCRPR